MNTLKKVSFGIIVVLVVMLGVYLYWPYSQTYDAMDKAMEEVKKLESPPAFMELEIKDGWGHPLIFLFQRDSTQLTYTVLSKGPDGDEGTADDIRKRYIDHNVSRIVGQWTAEKTREFLKGLKEGWDKKSKYEEQEKKP